MSYPPKKAHMSTLVIHTPPSEVRQNQKRSFHQTIETGVGRGYALNSRIYEQVSSGAPVVVICKAHKKQAEGLIRQLVPTEKTGNGIQRYDVVIVGLHITPFTHGATKLNRNGVAVV